MNYKNEVKYKINNNIELLLINFLRSEKLQKNYTSMNTRVYLQLYVFITHKWNYVVNF